MNRQLTETGTRSSWLLAGGSAAVILGIVFLAENLTQSDLDDLWALALLPLALAFVSQARHAYENVGTVTGPAAGWAVMGLSTAIVALALILGLDVGELWPVFFIIAGPGAMLAAWR